MTDLLASVSEDVVNAIAGEEWAKLLKLGERPDEQTRKEVLLNGWATTRCMNTICTDTPTTADDIMTETILRRR
jgi:hypothetical protein